MLHARRAGRRLALAGVLIVLMVASACTTSSTHFAPLPSATGSAAPASPTRPNIVFVLTDDLSWNLVRFMPHVLALEQRGTTFTNYTVTDSLCCPSRASIFTGRFPHDTHILTNLPPGGGFPEFHRRGEEKNTFATTLLKAGYRTGFMGKYLNAYHPNYPHPTPLQRLEGAYVPPGWTTWNGVGDGYPEFDYDMADGHDIVHYGHQPSDYLTDVVGRRAERFVRESKGSSRPFMLEVATFAPHKPYIPAPADRNTFTHTPAPRTPAFDRLPSPAPKWMAGRPKLTPTEVRDIQHWWQLRLESVQSVDRMIGNLEHTLDQTGQAGNTVFVFSSDNGYHLGEYTLDFGKQTAFDTDVRVPLIVAGPGIPAGVTNTDATENIDLRPTFEQLAGAQTPSDIDGHSLLGLLHGVPEPWRKYALIEHHYDLHNFLDPDRQEQRSGIPPSYDAIRSATEVYVRYVTGDVEYYDLTKDPYELHNLGPSLSAKRKASLNLVMDGLTHCHDQTACWSAGMPSG